MLVQSVHIAQRSTRLVERALRCTSRCPGTGGAPSPVIVEDESGAHRGWWVRRQAGRDDAHRRAEAERATGGLSGTEARSHNVQNRAGVREGEPRHAVEQQDRAQGRVIKPQQRTAGVDAHRSGRPINVPYVLPAGGSGTASIVRYSSTGFAGGGLPGFEPQGKRAEMSGYSPEGFHQAQIAPHVSMPIRVVPLGHPGRPAPGWVDLAISS